GDGEPVVGAVLPAEALDDLLQQRRRVVEVAATAVDDSQGAEGRGGEGGACGPLEQVGRGAEVPRRRAEAVARGLAPAQAEQRRGDVGVLGAEEGGLDVEDAPEQAVGFGEGEAAEAEVAQVAEPFGDLLVPGAEVAFEDREGLLVELPAAGFVAAV